MERTTSLGSVADEWHVEPWLAVDPQNPERLFAAVITLGSSEHGRHDVVAFASQDAGASWRVARASGRSDAIFPGGDPGIVALGDSTVLLSTLSDRGELRVWRSSDGLQYEDLPAVPGGPWDRPFLIETTGSNRGPTVYATGKFPARLLFGPDFSGQTLDATDVLGLVTSQDSGASWRGPRVVLPDPHHHVINSVGAPVIAADGSLLLPYFAVALDDLRDGEVDGSVWLHRARGPARVGEWRVWANRGDLRLATLGLSSGGFAVDRSGGEHDGRLYASWLTLVGGRYQVVLAHSDDDGSTWSPPLVVNDDDSAAHHSNPGLAVSASGAVGVIWNDRRGDPDSACFETRFAASVDGGETFLPSALLSRRAACPPPGADNPTRPFRFLNGGDTQGLAGLDDDWFVAVWIADGEEPGGPWVPHASLVRIER